MRNIVDFHIHGVGSKYKDVFATASYDHICAYFQRLGEKRNREIVIAFTEHDCSVMTYNQYKELQAKYPNVKIMLGMEANTKLTRATNGVFEVAHILAYADMSNEESIKKWFDCKELKDLSKIKTFQIVRQVPSKEEVVNKLKTIKFFVNKPGKGSMFAGLVPSQYSFSKETNVKLAVKKLEKLIGGPVDFAKLNSELNYNLNNTELDRQFARAAANIIAQDKSLLAKIKIKKLMKAAKIGNIKPEYVVNFITGKILKNARFNCEIKQTSHMFESTVQTENFGERLYMAKAILNKNIGTKITNTEIAQLLDNVKSRKVMREHFINLVKFSLKYRNPALYSKIEKLSTEDFARYPLGANDHGTITINTLVPLSPTANHGITTDIRTPLEEINEIVKNTGGHLMLAHPDLVFKYSDNKYIPANVFESGDSELVSNNKYKEIVKQLNDTGSINTTDLLGDKNKILKLELFFRLCKQNGIEFDGFEIRKANLKERESLKNYLVYAAKNDYDISFGSDAHFSNVHFYYDLFRNGVITQNEFDKLAAYADENGDTTTKENRYKVYYTSIFKTKKHNLNFARIKHCGGFLKNAKGKLYNPNYIVEQTSFGDKLLGKDNLENRPLLTIKYNDKVYYFDRSTLKKANYEFDDSASKEDAETEIEAETAGEEKEAEL